MKTLSIVKAAFAAALVSLLAACGGGNDAPEVSWASPAAFAGASSKSYALQGCYRSIYDDDAEEYIEDEVPLYNAKLVIGTNGDISIQAATTSTGAATAVWNFTYADATNLAWSVSGTTETPSYYITGYRGGRNNSSFYAYSNVGGGYISAYSNDNNTDIRLELDCDMTDKLALQINANAARAAKNLGTEAGVNTFDDYYTEGRIEGGNAFWYNEAGSSEYSNMRFNLGSGDLSSSSSTTGTYSSISLSLPSGTSSFGVYGESVTRGSSFFDYKDAKTVCLGRESMQTESGFALSVTAYGNKFLPGYGGIRFIGPQGFETPQAGGPGGCNIDN
jgi:hypothetical protein